MIMSKLQNMTIKQKLTAIIMLTSGVILLLAITVFVIWKQVDSRRHLVTELYAHAGVIAENSKASLAFSDKEDAKQILSALQADSSIVFACIYDKQGQVFAEFQSADITEKIQPPKPREDGHLCEPSCLGVFRNIVLDGEVIGTIYLRDDMSTVRSELVWDIVVALIILPIALIMSYFLTSKLQKVVSGPILSLAEVAKNVSEKKDYSARALKQSNDEVGWLIDTFNEMLEQIQRRDLELEKRVKERTAELSASNEHLKRFNKLAVGRELRMVELKKEINALLGEMGREGKYRSPSDIMETCSGGNHGEK